MFNLFGAPDKVLKAVFSFKIQDPIKAHALYFVNNVILVSFHLEQFFPLSPSFLYPFPPFFGLLSHWHF